MSCSISGGFILASSIHMNDSIPHARTVWNDSFSDIKIYTGNLLQVRDKLYMNLCIHDGLV